MRAALLAVAAATAAAARYYPSGPIIAGYTSDQECDSLIQKVVTQGVNVLLWSFIELGFNTTTGLPTIDTSDLAPLDCIASTANAIKAAGLQVSHFVSLGGWGQVHPPAGVQMPAIFKVFMDWNDNVVARNGFPGFDGLDIDMEGVNTLSSPDNEFTPGVLDMVGELLIALREAGLYASLVPPQSYASADSRDAGLFDLSLRHNYPDYEPTFMYHSWGSYWYLISRYGSFPASSPLAGQRVHNHIAVQLYESYSRALQNISAQGQPARQYLSQLCKQYAAGIHVPFSNVPGLNWPSQHVAIDPSQMVLGLANAWTDGSRALLVQPEEAGLAFQDLLASGTSMKGFAYWAISFEGQAPPGSSTPLWLAEGLNQYLHVRE